MLKIVINRAASTLIFLDAHTHAGSINMQIITRSSTSFARGQKTMNWGGARRGVRDCTTVWCVCVWWVRANTLCGEVTPGTCSHSVSVVSMCTRDSGARHGDPIASAGSARAACATLDFHFHFTRHASARPGSFGPVRARAPHSRGDISGAYGFALSCGSCASTSRTRAFSTPTLYISTAYTMMNTHL